MLISSDASAASNSGLRPAAISAIKSLATVRSVTLATTQYTEYPVAPLGTEIVVMSYTFQPYSISPGQQMRVHLYGETEAAVGGFSPTLWVAQPNGVVLTSLSYGTSGVKEKWTLDAAFSFSAYGDSSTPFASRSQSRTASVQAMQVRGFVDLKTGTPLGPIDERMNVGAATPLMVLTTEPFELYVTFLSDIAFNVHGGWMEAL